MATETKKIIMRRDTAARWESANPILANGEIGIDTTNRVMKIGDGVRGWNDLDGIPTSLSQTVGDNEHSVMSQSAVSRELREFAEYVRAREDLTGQFVTGAYSTNGEFNSSATSWKSARIKVSEGDTVYMSLMNASNAKSSLQFGVVKGDAFVVKRLGESYYSGKYVVEAGVTEVVLVTYIGGGSPYSASISSENYTIYEEVERLSYDTVDVTPMFAVGSATDKGTIDSSAVNWRSIVLNVRAGDVVYATLFGYSGLSSPQIVTIKNGVAEVVRRAKDGDFTGHYEVEADVQSLIMTTYVGGGDYYAFLRSRKRSGKTNTRRSAVWVGMSIWANDGTTIGDSIVRGFQTRIKAKYHFPLDSGTDYCFPGCSLGGVSPEDTRSIANMLKSCTASGVGLWTLDTITNDFKRDIPIGTIADYHNNTGVTTYYGALRITRDLMSSLGKSGCAVVCANSLRRNNDGYTSTSVNGANHSLLDYEYALLSVAKINGWYFVDQYRKGIAEEMLPLTTTDGLHLNDFGYSLAVLPWLEVLSSIEWDD